MAFHSRSGILRGCILVALLATLAPGAGGETVRRVIRSEQDQPNLLKDDAWQPMKKDYPFARDKDVFACSNGTDANSPRGICQTVVLNQTVPQAIVASLLSKAENAGGERNTDYSLYLDVFYADGEPLWEQVASFKVGTHDWERIEVKVLPAKPIKEVAFYMLFRKHAGAAWFKQPRLSLVASARGTSMLDGLPIKPGEPAGAGFWVRDVAGDSDFVSLEKGEALGLRLETKKTVRGEATFFTGALTDTTGKDRAVSLIYTQPLPGDSWRWLASPRRETATQAPQEYETATGFGAVGTGRLSTYPFAAVARDKQGCAIGIDMDRPAFFRTGYAAGTRELYVAYDLGLAKEKPSAEFAFCAYSFDSAWGFRAAAAKYYECFPEFFRCRTPRQGVWMPAFRISKVEGWQDFGFKFKEGNNETEWDDAHDILTFRYTEPMTWWMPLPKSSPRTLDAALAEAKRLAEKGDKSAQALLASAIHDEAGRPVMQLQHAPWCDGVVWSMNSSPGVRGDATDFHNKWNAGVREKLYGRGREGDLDGEYIDSIEGYVTAELDFRREHLSAARTALTFSAEDFRPAVFRGSIAYEYVRAIAEDAHGMGKLTMGNGTPDRLCWLAPWLDVMGTETDWNPRRKWQPMSDEEMLYRRVMCGAKPYCFLMNTSFPDFSHDLVEKYMKRCAAYGMFPGFFSHNASDEHYFSQPALYNRDRDLFRKYVPLCRQLAEASWQPITNARSSEPRVYVERFGEQYLTVFNDSGERKNVVITFAGKIPGRVKDLVVGAERPVADRKAALTLDAEDVAVLVLE